jgi:hypothetical protein
MTHVHACIHVELCFVLVVPFCFLDVGITPTTVIRVNQGRCASASEMKSPSLPSVCPSVPLSNPHPAGNAMRMRGVDVGEQPHTFPHDSSSKAALSAPRPFPTADSMQHVWGFRQRNSLLYVSVSGPRLASLRRALQSDEWGVGYYSISPYNGEKEFLIRTTPFDHFLLTPVPVRTPKKITAIRLITTVQQP